MHKFEVPKKAHGDLIGRGGSKPPTLLLSALRD